MYKVEEVLVIEDVVKSLTRQNRQLLQNRQLMYLLKDSDVKFEFKMETRMGVNMIFSLNPKAFQDIIKIDKVNL